MLNLLGADCPRRGNRSRLENAPSAWLTQTHFPNMCRRLVSCVYVFTGLKNGRGFWALPMFFTEVILEGAKLVTLTRPIFSLLL